MAAPYKTNMNTFGISTIGDLRSFILPFTDECKFTKSIKINYELHDGEGFLHIELTNINNVPPSKEQSKNA